MDFLLAQLNQKKACMKKYQQGQPGKGFFAFTSPVPTGSFWEKVTVQTSQMRKGRGSLGEASPGRGLPESENQLNRILNQQRNI